MIQFQGVWFPDDVKGEKWKYSLRHVQSIEWAIAACRQRRTAVQAGGNIGLWPKRLAAVFQRVISFEPEPISRECLLANAPSSVEVIGMALGAAHGVCGIDRKSVGSHRVVVGDEISMTTVDALALTDLDFLQLDIEGYEWHALVGAKDTIARCHPLIQVELRTHTEKYGQSEASVRALLAEYGYREVSKQPGMDVVFQWGLA